MWYLMYIELAMYVCSQSGCLELALYPQHSMARLVHLPLNIILLLIESSGEHHQSANYISALLSFNSCIIRETNQYSIMEYYNFSIQLLQDDDGHSPTQHSGQGWTSLREYSQRSLYNVAEWKW